MLNDLIFLGQIPGTSIQISFNDIVVALMLALALYILRKLFSISKIFKLDNRRTYILEREWFNLPVQEIGHISLVLVIRTVALQADSIDFPIPQAV